MLQRSDAREGSRPAIVQGARELSYAQFADRVARLGSGLRRRGLQPGDRVGIFQSHRPELLETMFACWHEGMICVPVNARTTPFEAAEILRDSQPAALIAEPEYAAHVAEAGIDGLVIGITEGIDGAESYDDVLSTTPEPPVSVAAETPAWLFYSSGTTGRMKGATLTHRNLAFMVERFLSDLDPMTTGSVVLHAAPLTHGSGLYALPPVAVAATQVLTTSRSFDSGEVLATVAARRVTNIAFLAPTMVNRMVRAQRDIGADTSSLRCCVYGGAPMYVEDIKAALETFGPVLAQIYGQAECPMTIARLRPRDHAELAAAGDEARLASTGRPYSGVEVRVADADDQPVSAGERGEIIVRCDAVMSHYWNNPDATDKTLRGGWLHTGDIGRVDGDGLLYLVDRSKDVIISGAANIYPREVEEVLLRHPLVREACVIGAPDPEWGERVVAVLAVEAGAGDGLARELETLCRERLSAYKIPREIEILPELPKSPYGKILKREVRDRYWRGRDRMV